MEQTEQLKTDADKLLARWRELPARAAGEDLRDVDRQAILALRAEGKKQAEIAKIIGCDQSTVSRTLNEFTDTRQLARAILDSGAASMARKVRDEGKPDLLLKVLGKLDVVREDRDGGGHVTNTQNIVIYSPIESFRELGPDDRIALDDCGPTFGDGRPAPRRLVVDRVSPVATGRFFGLPWPVAEIPPGTKMTPEAAEFLQSGRCGPDGCEIVGGEIAEA